MRRLDLAGLKFGSLTAMAPVGKSEKGHILWKCVCACGKEIEAKAGDLRAGHRTSCGCGRIRDLSGQRFGHLLAVRLVEMNKHGAAMWECQCDCGALKVISSPHLLKGDNKTCGCNLRLKLMKENRTTHGGHDTRLYSIYWNMLCRCYNKNTTRYKHYGGKGVTVCAEWNTFVLFRDWALSNGYQEGLTIDRIDNNGNYEPSNCRWITNRMQQRNRGNNRVLTFKGESLCMADWADKLGLPYHVIKSRVYLKDWTIEEILTTPVGKKRSSKL